MNVAKSVAEKIMKTCNKQKDDVVKKEKFINWETFKRCSSNYIIRSLVANETLRSQQLFYQTSQLLSQLSLKLEENDRITFI
jgi:hypothetical protein